MAETKAYKVSCNDEDHGTEIVFAGSASEARKRFSNEWCDCGYIELRAIRAPYLDTYAPGPVSLKTLVMMDHPDALWYGVCNECERHVHSDHEGAIWVDDDNRVFCSEACRQKHFDFWRGHPNCPDHVTNEPALAKATPSTTEATSDTRAGEGAALARVEPAPADQVREALAPVIDWFQSDEEDDRPTLDIVRDVAVQLESDRRDLLATTTELAKARAGGNYIVDDDSLPRAVLFANGRMVWISGNHLRVESIDSKPADAPLRFNDAQQALRDAMLPCVKDEAEKAPAPAPKDRDAQCFDCGLPYGSSAWADVVLPDDVWRRISPDGEGDVLLCFNCMNARLEAAGIETTCKITSGPMCASPGVGELVEALEFYAKREHYTRGPNGGFDEKRTVMELDSGDRAREALARHRAASRQEAGGGADPAQPRPAAEREGSETNG